MHRKAVLVYNLNKYRGRVEPGSHSDNWMLLEGTQLRKVRETISLFAFVLAIGNNKMKLIGFWLF